MSRRKQSNPKPLKVDEPWAEGEEGDNEQRAKESSTTEEDSDRPKSSATNEEIHIKTEPCTEESTNNEEELSLKHPSGDEQGTENDEQISETGIVKVKPVDDIPIVPKTRKNPTTPIEPSSSFSSCNEESINASKERKASVSSVGNMELALGKRRGSNRSRSSNLGDSSEVEHSETDETDDRRISSRREQDFGSSSRSRTPERPGSDFGGSPGPFSSQQQQQFLQASIPYLHLLPPHIRNDAARLFLMPQMLPPELAAAAAAAAATSTSKSPSPGSSGGNTGSGNVSTSQTVPSTSATISGGKSEKILSGENSRSGAIFVCEPCNIKFSSAKTLEAHQTYYCSFRKDSGRESVRIEVEDVKPELMMPVTSGSGSSSSSSKKRDRENSDEHELTMDESLESIDSFSANPGSSMNQNKSQKTGKLYSCIYCSYSADKKVSLNRHMRMHSGLSISANQMPNSKDDHEQLTAATATASLGSRPVTPGKSPSSSAAPTPSSSKNIQDGVSAMERYCQDCDIQFSSIKTFRVHKQYYCSTRHVLKAQQSVVAAAVAAAAVAAGGSPVSAALGKAPVELGPGVTVTPIGKPSASIGSACSPIPGEGSPVSTPGPMASQPFVVLPTNPVIVVPYCFIQGASFLPGNVLPSQNAIIVMPNGTVQSLPGIGGTGPGGIPIPIPSPSPQSMILGSHLMMHSPFPSSTTPGPSNLMSPNNVTFSDPKEMMKMMSSSSSGHKESREDEEMMSPNKVHKSNSRNSGRSSRSSEDASSHHDHSRVHEGTNDVCDDGSMPAIDLTFRGIQPKKENTSGGGDDEKENREEMCASVGSRNSRNVSRDSLPGALEDNSRSRSATPAASVGHGTSSSAHQSHHDNITHHRDRESPLEKMSMGSGSGGKRTPRPSSTSVNSSCSTPPALCEPKINGMMSQIISPGGKDPHDHTSLNNKMVMMMLNASAAAAAAALESGCASAGSSRGKKGSVDYNSMVRSSRGSSSGSGGNGGKISPMATQLPGGAILTSATSNQSLAELLMTNPPELNESLAKLNPQLLMNAHRAAAAAVATGNSPVGFNFNLNPAFMQALNPEIAMRLLDPSYLSTLQQSIQQQQQQTSTTQPAQGPIKRGVSKCVECDIVFYKYENYLVHKEHYCAARTNNTNTGNNVYPPQSSTPTATSKGKGTRGNGTHRGKDASRMSSCSSPSKSELDDDECISPPPPMPRKVSSGNLRKSPDSSPAIGAQSLLLNKTKSKSPQNVITSPTSDSPVPSPKSFGVGVITSSQNSNSNKDDEKSCGGNSSSNQFPCSVCGVKFSAIDNLHTHQTYYCNKRIKGVTSLNIGYGDNNGDKEYSSEGKAGNNNGDAFMMELLASASNNQSSHEKDIMSAAQAIGLATTRNKSPGPGGSCRNGFLRCGKCKLPIPEEQMSTHIRVCLGTVSPSFGNGRGGGGEMGGGVGWKCPCCDVYSATVSAAQKHLETHTGIRAFKCLLCGYRGNTLRGMRTHIRTHFDKRVFDLLEGDYMTCITANDVEPMSSAGNNGNNTNNNSNNVHDQIHRAMQSPNAFTGAINRSTGAHILQQESSKANNGKNSRYSPETCKNVNHPSKGASSSLVAPAHAEESLSPSSTPFIEEGSDIKVFQSPSDMMMMTMMTGSDSNASSSAENNNQFHYCSLCNYSSPFKANIIKHMKLVHKVQIPLDLGEAEAAAMMLMHGSSSADHDGLTSMAMIMNRGEVAVDDVNGDSSRNSTPKSTLEYAIAQGFTVGNTVPSSVTGGKSLFPSAATAPESSSTRSRRVAAAVPNGASGIAPDIKVEEGVVERAERKCSSHSSAEDDIEKGEKLQQHQQHGHSTAGSSSFPGNGSGVSENYCKSCDISFKYVSSFIAHKKSYCSSHVSSDTEAPERAETPVQ